MRTIEIRNHTSAGAGSVEATITYDGKTVSFAGQPKEVASLQHGVTVFTAKGRHVVTPDAGAHYMDAVLAMYKRMSYFTAEEVDA